MPVSIGVGVALAFAAFASASGAAEARVAFFDLLEAASRWQDTAGTTPAAAAGDPIGRLDDRAGSFDLVQATSGARPLLSLTAGAQGNRPAAVFDGSNDHLASAAELESTGGGTLIWVGSLSTGGAFGHQHAPLASYQGDYLFAGYVGGYRGTFVETAPPTFPAGYHVFALVIDPEGAAPRALYIDGVLFWSSATSIGTGALTGPLILGALYAGGFFGAASAHEWQVWRGALSGATIATKSAELVDKWDILPTPPGNLSGLVWCVDNVIPANMWQERSASAGSWATAADGDLEAVGSVRDLGSAAAHPYAPSDAARPTLEVADGKGRLCFDGANDVLRGAQVTVSGAWTLAMSYQLRTVPGALSGVALVNISTGTGEKIELVAINYSGFRKLTWSAKMTTTGAVSVGIDKGLDTSPHRVVITYDGGTKSSAGSYRCWFDGVEETVSTGTAIGAIGGDTTAIGARWNGSAASANAAVNVDTILLYDNAKSETDVVKINDLLARKRRRPRLLLVIGDSIAAGWVGGVGAVVKASSWAYKVKKLYPDASEPDLINVAVPGQTTATALANVATLTDILTEAESVQVVIGSGINDVGTDGLLVDSGSATTALSNLWALCDAIKAIRSDADITVQTILPRSDASKAAGYDARKVTYNDGLAAGYTAHADRLDDLRPVEGSVTVGDGIHPTDGGHDVIALSTYDTLTA